MRGPLYLQVQLEIIEILDYVLFSYDRLNNVLRMKTELEIKNHTIIVKI